LSGVLLLVAVSIIITIIRIITPIIIKDVITDAFDEMRLDSVMQANAIVMLNPITEIIIMVVINGEDVGNAFYLLILNHAITQIMGMRIFRRNSLVIFKFG
jgi:hypothetical protein